MAQTLMRDTDSDCYVIDAIRSDTGFWGHAEHILSAPVGYLNSPVLSKRVRDITLISSSVGWELGGKHVGYYLMIARFGRGDRAGDISIRSCLAEQNQSSARVVDLSTHEADMQSMTMVIVVKKISNDIRNLIRSKVLRIRSRRRLGQCVRLVASMPTAHVNHILQAINSDTVTARPLTERMQSGYTFRHEDVVWDALFGNATTQLHGVVRESPKSLTVDHESDSSMAAARRSLEGKNPA
eukprot:8641927-Karenia_brevis.AAC.1